MGRNNAMLRIEALTVTAVLTDRLDLDGFTTKLFTHSEYSIGIFAAMVFYRIFCIGKIHTICCMLLFSIQQIIHLDYVGDTSV